MKTLTLDMIHKSEDKLLKEYGENFVYNPDGLNKCFYNPNENGPQKDVGCIVGEIFKDNNLLTPAIIKNGQDVTTLIRLALVEVDNEETKTYLGILQYQQDKGASWGKAVKTAKEEIAYMRAVKTCTACNTTVTMSAAEGWRDSNRNATCNASPDNKHKVEILKRRGTAARK